MDKLKSLNYSVSLSYNRSSLCTRYTWAFCDTENVLKYLEYDHVVYNINTINKKSRIRKDIEHITTTYTVYSCIDKSTTNRIRKIDEWLTDNYQYIKNSDDNYIKSLEIIEYLKSELGEYNYALIYEVGWAIKGFYKLYIDLYSGKITLDYKGKATILSEQKLKTFVQKNKKGIFQAKENNHKKYIQSLNERREKERLEHLANETKKLIIQESAHDATRKVGSHNKCTSFIIKRRLKERYETQACKPLPVKYPWITKT
jgi:hypothetical protein